MLKNKADRWFVRWILSTLEGIVLRRVRRLIERYGRCYYLEEFSASLLNMTLA